MHLSGPDGALSPVNLEMKLVSLGDGMGVMDAVKSGTQPVSLIRSDSNWQ